MTAVDDGNAENAGALPRVGLGLGLVLTLCSACRANGIDSNYIHVIGLRLPSRVMTLPFSPENGELRSQFPRLCRTNQKAPSKDEAF